MWEAPSGRTGAEGSTGAWERGKTYNLHQEVLSRLVNAILEQNFFKLVVLVGLPKIPPRLCAVPAGPRSGSMPSGRLRASQEAG